MSAAVIVNRQRRHRVALSRLKRFASILSRRLGIEDLEFTLVLTNDRVLRRLNRRFRNKDKPTDILSFPCQTVALAEAGSRQSPLPSVTVGLLKSTEAKSVARASARARLRFNHFQDFDGALSAEAPCLDNPCLGDMIVSVETASRQALERNHSLERELCILMIHGLLHLLGYDHEVDRGRMRRKELRLQRELL